MLENISFDFDFCFGVCLGFPIMGTCCSDTIFHPGGGSGLPPHLLLQKYYFGNCATFHNQTSRLDQHNSLGNLCILKDEENPRRDVGTFGDNLPIVLR